MRSSDEADACKKENSTEYKIDENFFNILHAATGLHEIHGYSKESQYNSDDPFFHFRYLSALMQTSDQGPR